jgi:hypothetical protein
MKTLKLVATSVLIPLILYHIGKCLSFKSLTKNEIFMLQYCMKKKYSTYVNRFHPMEGNHSYISRYRMKLFIPFGTVYVCSPDASLQNNTFEYVFILCSMRPGPEVKRNLQIFSNSDVHLWLK